MRLLVYSLLRLAVFGAALGLGYLLGLRNWLLVLVAVVIAAAVSYLVLKGPRDAAVAALAEGGERRRTRPARVDVDAEHEDAVDEAARAAATGTPVTPVAATGPEPGAVMPPAPGDGPGSERERDPQHQAVREFQQAGGAQDADEVAPGGSPQHHPHDPNGR